MKYKVKSVYTRTGYNVNIFAVSDEVNGISIYDHNLYPDYDYRSKEKGEIVININSIAELKRIGKAILKVCKKCKKA